MAEGVRLLGSSLTLLCMGWEAKALHLGSAANVRKLLRQAKESGRY
jgi:hypothetical protein